MEIWKPIKDFEDRYEISSSGRVRSLLSGKIRKFKMTKAGYIRFALCANGKQKILMAHRIVAEAFLKNPENKKCVNHKDEDKKNNLVENLEWVTHLENNNHGTRGKRISEALKKAVIEVDTEGNNIAEYESLTEMSIRKNISISYCSQICNDKSNKKFIFKN